MDLQERICEVNWIDDEYDKLVESISEKLKEFFTGKRLFEPLQIAKYKVGGKFTPHYDCGEGATPNVASEDEGNRQFTVLIYLNDDFEGGETRFIHIDKNIKPKKGKAIIFKSLTNDGKVIKESYHEGESVIYGEKWIANKWIHRII